MKKSKTKKSKATDTPTKAIKAIKAMNVTKPTVSVQKRVLLVEDDIFVSKAYVHFIAKSGFTVDAAMNVVEARKKISAHMPDIILLDIIMPGINGFEYLAELKKNAKTARIPVMIVSNLCQESAMTRCKKLGAVDYLIKSNVFLRDVVDRIGNHIEINK